MFLELNEMDPNNLATGKLIRKNQEFEFKYSTLPESRRYATDHPIEGLVRLKASVSIKTKNDLTYSHGDKVLLEGYNATLTVVNLTKRVTERQFMFLNDPVDVEWVLDLE